MDCLFCKIIEGEIPATIVLQDSQIVAFKDIRPVAPTHLLIIPKQHIATLNDIETKDAPLLGHMVLTAKNLAHTMNINEEGYRLVFNTNAGGGQAVYHIHLHLIGGRAMIWPPG